MEVRKADILLADPDPDEQATLQRLLCQRYDPILLVCFSDPLLAVKYGANNHLDAVYTAVRMKRLSGYELGRLLRSFHPEIKLHFIADTKAEYAEAMRLLADSCILRPVTEIAFRTGIEATEQSQKERMKKE